MFSDHPLSTNHCTQHWRFKNADIISLPGFSLVGRIRLGRWWLSNLKLGRENQHLGAVPSLPSAHAILSYLTLTVFQKNCFFIRHNTITGRWLTRFQAVWDPKQEDCIIVGSMAQPRRVEVFHETGKWVHSFLGGECLASVCSINAVHPTRYILAGGNSSGRVHVFMN